MRFFWKPVEKVKAKILKKVKFPIVLDTYELCAPALQTALLPARAALKQKEEDEKAAKVRVPRSFIASAFVFAFAATSADCS
jgi:ubiquitin carboxyl-terminal hydrolase 14